MERELHILMLEDNAADAELIAYTLRKSGFGLVSRRVETEEDFRKELTDFQPDVILLDYELPTFDGLSALNISKSMAPDTPVIFVTGVLGEESAIDMLHRGATDYVLKEKLSRLVPAVERALGEVEETARRRAAEEDLRNFQIALRKTQFTVDHSADSVFWLTPEAKIIYANEEAYRRRGYTREEMLSLTIFDINVDFAADPDIWEMLIKRLRESGHFTSEFRHSTKNGDVFPVEVMLNRLEFEGDEIFVENIRDITERKAAEEVLRRTQFTVDHSADSVFLVTSEGKIIYANEEACRRRGYTREEMLSLKIFDINDSIAADPGLWESIRERIQQEGHFTVEFRHRTKGGEIFPVEAALNFFDLEGDWLFVAHDRDITERKAAEDVLRESEKRLAEANAIMSAVLENTHMMAVFLDPQFNFIWVNPAYARTWGHDQSYFPGKNHFDLYPHEEYEAIFRHVVDTGEPFYVAAKPFEFPDQPERGVTYSDWSLVPVRNADGGMAGLVFTLADVTERERRLDTLRRSEELLRETQHLSRVGGWAYNVAGNTMYWTEETYRIHGFPPFEPELGSSEHIARSVECYEPEDRPVILAAFERCIKSGEPYDLEFPFTTADGRRLRIRTTAHAVRDAGEVVKVVGNIMDITELKQAEESLRRANEELRGYTRTVSHDLKDPLSGVALGADYLARILEEEGTGAP